MLENLKRFILMVVFIVMLEPLAMAQSHFMYIQSEEGTPFYIKMKDSILSSTHSGYLVLNQLEEGTYPVIIGFAKKKIPEAAFKITIDDSEDKGYTLRSVGGKLQLVNIQSNTIIQPAEVATSAGNRILPSTIAGMDEQSERQKADQKPADHTKSSSPAKELAENQTLEPEGNPSEPEDNPFETMLNAVTGSTSPSSSEVEKQDVAQNTPALEKSSSIAEVPTSEEKVTMPREKEEVPEEKEETSSFYDLLHPDTNAPVTKAQEQKPVTTPETVTPEPAPPAHENQDLTFIDFSSVPDTKGKEQQNVQEDENRYNDTIITSGKELRRWKQQRLAKQKDGQPEVGSLFDRLLEKVDTVTVDTAGSSSVASPLFGEDKASQNEITVAKDVLCNEVADEQYFNKVLRRIASKKSEQTMLRTANRYLSDDKCFTISQIKQLTYLFPSDEFRLQFLKAAYLHCAEKDKYQTLIRTLSGKRYQNRLKDYIR